MDLKDLQNFLSGKNTFAQFWLREPQVPLPNVPCRLCRKVAAGKRVVVEVACCKALLCSDCYWDYFYRPGEYSKAGTASNHFEGMARGLLVVPAVLERYELAMGICRFRCPYCKKVTVYNYREGTQKTRNRFF